VLGYRVDSDEVVFVFEPAAFGVQIAADARVDVAGDFNQWLDASDGKIHNPAPAWQMQRVAGDRYELHKQLADFHQRPQWEFKFVVNLSQWIEVPGTALNRTTGQPVNLTLTIPEKPGEPPNGGFGVWRLTKAGRFRHMTSTSRKSGGAMGRKAVLPTKNGAAQQGLARNF
jgi:hypothetical protein